MSLPLQDNVGARQHHMNSNILSTTLSLARRVLLLGLLVIGMPQAVDAARLYMTPASGAFPVGETFSVKLFLDTKQQDVNALDVQVVFPADRLQLVAPNTSVSLIDVWASQPKFNNRTGEIRFRGGIPNGVSTSGGLIGELTFRVRSTGQAFVRFSSASQVFLNDGKATPVGLDFQNAIVELELPPPAGPAVSSPTHDQGAWSSSPDVAFSWFASGADAYSYVLDQSPVTEPDRTPEGTEPATFYSDIQSGVSYFHVRALRGGIWGGTTHYEIKIDNQPPAAFGIDVFPSDRTSVRQPTISFRTSDADSGLSHYELNVIPLMADNGDTAQTSFIEVTSPYITHELSPGAYEVLVRAYDHAGNFREQAQRVRIVSGALTLTRGDGLIIRDVITVPWYVLVFLMVALLGLGLRELLLVRKLRRVCKVVPQPSEKTGTLPPEMKEALEELHKYRKKYGHLTVLAIFLVAGLFMGVGAHAQDLPQNQALLSTPQITSWSEYVTNDEIFYLRGVSDARTQEVLVYVQDLRDGSLERFLVPLTETRDWLYRHNEVLSPGEYAIWVQGRAGEQVSPPGAQYSLIVEREALRIGASSISVAILYMGVIIMLSLLLLAGFLIMRHHRKRLERRYQAYLLETKEAEVAVRRGFAQLQETLVAHLEDLKRRATNGTLKPEDVSADEAELVADLKVIKANIKKEVVDIEELLRAHEQEP